MERIGVGFVRNRRGSNGYMVKHDWISADIQSCFCSDEI